MRHLNIKIILFFLLLFFPSEVQMRDSDNVSSDEIRRFINQRNQTSQISEEGNVEGIYNNQYSVKQTFADSIKVIDYNIIEGKTKELQFFGYDFFKDSQDKKIWDNQPPPVEYILGPGDEIIIEIWGDTQLRVSHIINQYGKIYVDKIGQIYATGVKVTDIEKKLFNKFQNVYSSLKGDNPTAFLDVSIGKLKSINITVLGESGMPGIHTIHPFSSIVTSLLQTGGVRETGSLRDIQLIRNSKTIQSFDFYQYLINANTTEDSRLLDGDVIFIPLRKNTVSIQGEIFKPAKYEIRSNEKLEDLVGYAGGLTVMALQNIRINRIINAHKSYPKDPYARTLIVNFLSENNYILEDGDDVLVYKIYPAENQVYIYGQVKSPGEYSFATSFSMKVLDLMKVAGGINDATFMKTVYLTDAEIIRNNPNTNFPEIIKFNIQSLLNGDPKANITLQNWDIILIRENPKYKTPDKVTISGEVKVPGVYTLQKRWEQLDDILARAGGFTEKAYVDGLKLFRDSNQIVLTDYNISLTNGDSIFVPQPAGTVEIIGAVNRPGFVQYERGKSLKDYIRSAGGYNFIANIENITIVSANGYVTTNNQFFKTKIGNGATIIVHEKAEDNSFDITEYATNLASIISSLATIFLLINQ